MMVCYGVLPLVHWPVGQICDQDFHSVMVVHDDNCHPGVNRISPIFNV